MDFSLSGVFETPEIARSITPVSRLARTDENSMSEILVQHQGLLLFPFNKNIKAKDFVFVIYIFVKFERWVVCIATHDDFS
ncbi:Uncharacterised protein [Peptoniphilus harei]|uniref:Uncharacterized protein n=1 Tax=Peptoniphilus harei TaxID=54005 RepID=A0A2X1X5R9_9FIRM|nr:Uncharacterised protein [Peptoniphilus harei]